MNDVAIAKRADGSAHLRGVLERSTNTLLSKDRPLGDVMFATGGSSFLFAPIDVRMFSAFESYILKRCTLSTLSYFSSPTASGVSSVVC